MAMPVTAAGHTKTRRQRLRPARRRSISANQVPPIPSCTSVSTRRPHTANPSAAIHVAVLAVSDDIRSHPVPATVTQEIAVHATANGRETAAVGLRCLLRSHPARIAPEIENTVISAVPVNAKPTKRRSAHQAAGTRVCWSIGWSLRSSSTVPSAVRAPAIHPWLSHQRPGVPEGVSLRSLISRSSPSAATVICPERVRRGSSGPRLPNVCSWKVPTGATGSGVAAHSGVIVGWPPRGIGAG